MDELMPYLLGGFLFMAVVFWVVDGALDLWNLWLDRRHTERLIRDIEKRRKGA